MAREGKIDGGPMTLAVQPRRFITGVNLPALAAARLYNPAEKPRGLARFRRKLAQTADDALHGALGIPSRGRMTVTLADRRTGSFGFDAHQSAYLAFASRHRDGGYEPDETLFLDTVLPRAQTFYDVGANWGYYTLLAATHPGFNGRIFAFDIASAMNLALADMVKALGLSSVTVAGYGLSDSDGMAPVTGEKAAHLTRVAEAGGAPGAPGALATLRRLDGLDLPPPDLIKVDTEDHERAVFEGARETLSRHRPLILFESRTEPDGGSAGAVLRALGYRLWRLERGAASVDSPESLALHPLPRGATTGAPLNIVAIAAGKEARWVE